ncbi:6-phosphogluconolactonase [Salinibacterium hongtaonis]|uniref:6-phosphogluconolactonase n=1 Tax=Homoserinimonas hongtaonis TaxID=2079791 RepID=A0A2U1SYR2_9MICO|nr:6-phosphogluconolactonase [Salinibacterium hongtaonis]AWB89235.1 6-phosphogluconolactonase [Salinibacterium hongtaonis]PWB96683.1 6-phosphogluconolactonase [Salinibacterium hongtaonis]
MTQPRRQVIVHDSKDALVDSVAGRFIAEIVSLQSEQSRVSVCLTGGSVGIGVLAAVAASPLRNTINWGRIDLWWGDERWVPAHHADRNAQQAWDALLGSVEVPEANLHAFPAADSGLTLDEAAVKYAEDLRSAAAPGDDAVAFDLLFLGVGPDGHVASLFPRRGELDDAGTVVAIRDSPKPPPERLSLTMPVINKAQRVWLVVAGQDKASALGLALAGASVHLVPVAGVQGQRETIFFVDNDAAVDVPRELIDGND